MEVEAADPAAAAFEDAANVSATMAPGAAGGAAAELVAEAPVASGDAAMTDASDSDSDSDSDSGSGSGSPWNIGFVEPCDARLLSRQFFPSKVGGAPAWLHPVDVPTAKQLKCLYTREPLDFLLQVYAPVDEEPTAFHRSVFLFVSPHGGDAHRPGAARAFRSQLPRVNPFYPDEPADEDGPLQELDEAQQRAYDARDDRWADRPTDVGAVVRKPRTFPEYELVVEPETLDDDVDAEEEDRRGGFSESEGPPGRRGGKLAPSDANQVPEALRERGADVSAAELLDLERSIQDKDQVQLSKFHLRLRRSGDPAHAIRYRFDDGAKPLWPSVTHAPEVSKRTVPDCPRCGSPRRFEFQVLPQIINHLGVDSELHSALDFGSVAVFTCAASCAPPEEEPGGAGAPAGADGTSAAYAEEIVLVHPPMNA